MPREIGPDAPLKPKPGDPPGDIAFGAYQRGYYITALREAQKRLDANPRDAAAMTLIGEIYHDGFAVKRDDEEAARWWRLAAERGDSPGAYEYGVALLSGAGVAPDKAAARRRIHRTPPTGPSRRALQSRRAGAAGRARTASPTSPPPPPISAARRRPATATPPIPMACCCARAKAFALDTDAAAMWLKRAADDGIIAGQVEYAIMLFNGVGVEQGRGGARRRIFRLAAARRNPDRAEPARASLCRPAAACPRTSCAPRCGPASPAPPGLKDDKLDAAIGSLTPEQIKQVNELARQQAEF